MNEDFANIHLRLEKDCVFIRVTLPSGQILEQTANNGRSLKVTLKGDSGTTKVVITPGDGGVGDVVDQIFTPNPQPVFQRATGCACWIILFITITIFAALKGLFGA